MAIMAAGETMTTTAPEPTKARSRTEMLATLKANGYMGPTSLAPAASRQ